MDCREKRYSIPDEYVVIPRNDWYIFYDPVHFSYTRVNEDGKAIIEAVGREESAFEISRKVAAKCDLEPVEIENQISEFLENMVLTRFLHEGPYRPDIPESNDIDASVPKTLYVSPTFKCSLNCLYCYNKDQRKRAVGRELTADEWFDAFDQALDLGVEVVIFTGGEPLMRKDVMELAQYANKIGLSSQLMTNATLINEKNLDRLINSFGSFALSLDSHIKETNDFLRGRGAYDKTLNAFRLLTEKKRTCTLMAVITKHNVWDIPGLYKFALEELNCSSIYNSLFIPNSLDEAVLLPQLEDYLEAMRRVVNVVEDFYGEDKLAIMRFHGKPVNHTHCGAAAAELSIDADGSVYPCQAFHLEEFCGGNIRDKKLQEIFHHSPIMTKVRDCTVDKIETCCDCDIRNACGGGCRSLAYNLHGKLNSCNSFNCEFLKNMIYNSFWNSTCVPIDQLNDIKEQAEKEKSEKSI